MKRINPNTNLPYRKGQLRSDGWKFNCYLNTLNDDGYFKELWTYIEPKKVKPKTIPKSKHWSIGNTLSGRMGRILACARQHSRDRKHPVPEITKDDLINLWNKQSGLCSYTGWPMEFTIGSPKVVSLERKDQTIGYTKENITLVCWCVNDAKGKLKHDEFIELCKAVINHDAKKTK